MPSWVTFLWCLAVIWSSNELVLPSLPPCSHCKKQHDLTLLFNCFHLIHLLSKKTMAQRMPIVNRTDIVTTSIVSWCFLQKLLGFTGGRAFTFTTVKCIELAIDTLSGSTIFLFKSVFGNDNSRSLWSVCSR